jgi:bleomycin hydrolase
MERNLTAEQLELFEKEFASNPSYRVMQNAVTQTPINTFLVVIMVV